MIKAISKYILSLIILLLGLSNQLSAFSSKESIYIAPTQRFKNANTEADIQNRNLAIVFTSNEAESRGNLLYDCSEEQEEDDDEKTIISHKKNHANTCLCFSSFYGAFTRLSALLSPQVLHFGKHFSQYPLQKLFIVFGVFRI